MELPEQNLHIQTMNQINEPIDEIMEKPISATTALSVYDYNNVAIVGNNNYGGVAPMTSLNEQSSVISTSWDAKQQPYHYGQTIGFPEQYNEGHSLIRKQQLQQEKSQQQYQQQNIVSHYPNPLDSPTNIVNKKRSKNPLHSRQNSSTRRGRQNELQTLNMPMSAVEMIAKNATGTSGNPLKDLKLELSVKERHLEMEQRKANQLQLQLSHERKNMIQRTESQRMELESRLRNMTNVANDNVKKKEEEVETLTKQIADLNEQLQTLISELVLHKLVRLHPHLEIF